MDSIALIVPVYNENQTVASFIADWSTELRRLRVPFRIFVVEDGSTDRTWETLQTLKRHHPRITILHSKKRLGYGYAVQKGMHKSDARYLLHVDSDGQYDPTDIPYLWELRTSSDVVMGVRTKRNDPFVRKFGSFLFSLYFRLLYPCRLQDPSTPFVLYRREAIVPYRLDLTYCSEAFWWGFSGMCIKRGLSVQEVPIHHRKRPDGKSRVFSLKTLPKIVMQNSGALLKLRFAEV